MFTEEGLHGICGPFYTGLPLRTLELLRLEHGTQVGSYRVWTEHPAAGDHLRPFLVPTRRARCLSRDHSHWIFELVFQHNGFKIVVRWHEPIYDTEGY